MKRLILATFAFAIALMANAADYDFEYEFYNGVKLYCKITKAATSTKPSGYGEVTVVGGTGPKGSEVFIDLVKYNGYDYKPTAIVARAFEGANWIGSLYLSSYPKSVGDYAFKYCTNMKSISISQGVTLGKGEFTECNSLTRVTIPLGVTTIPEECFCKCPNIAQLTIGRDVTTIGDKAFYGCSSLDNLVVPETVTSVGFMCFAESGAYDSTIEIRCDVVNYAFINMHFRHVTLAETIKNFDYKSLSSTITDFYIYSDAVTHNQGYTYEKNLYCCAVYGDDTNTAY